MASPVSIGDAITIVTQICQLYDAYRSTPDKLRRIIQGFKDVEQELKTLNGVLASSRRKEHCTYPHTAALVSDLSAARDYFQRFEPLVDDKGRVGMMVKVKGAIRVKWDESKVNAHIANINLHRERMKDFKQTVLIQAAQDNIELQIGAIQLQLGRTHGVAPLNQLTRDTADDSSSISSDQMSILTRASKSLSIADRLESARAVRSSLKLPAFLEPTPSSSTSSANLSYDLRRTIAEYVESKELYRPEVLQDAKILELQYVADLPELWLSLQHDNGPQPIRNNSQTSNGLAIAQVVSSTDASQLHPSYVVASNASGSSDTASLSSSSRSTQPFDRLTYEGLAQSIPSTEIAPDLTLGLETSSMADTILSDDLDVQNDGLTLQDSVMLFTPWTKDLPISCNLTLVQSASSLSLRSTTRQISRPSAVSTLDSGSDIVLSAMMSRRSSISTVASITEAQPMVFHHAVLGGMRSFPRVLHPRVESRTAHSHPFSIEFYTHQFLSLEGDDQREKAVKGVAYQFRSKEDRDFVRARIFGKKLLASTGVTTVQFDKKVTAKPCGTEAVSLWTTDNAGPDNLTITIQCSTRGKPEPDCAQEFTILKAKGLKKARDEQNKELSLTIRPAPAPSFSADDDPVAASGGLGSSGASDVSCYSDTGTSPQSRRSSIFSHRRSSNSHAASPGPNSENTQSFHCFIKFTEGADGLTLSKRSFLNTLQTYLPGENSSV